MHFLQKTLWVCKAFLVFFSQTEFFLGFLSFTVIVSQNINPKVKLRLRNFLLDNSLLIAREKTPQEALASYLLKFFLNKTGFVALC
jgi:hypothetical protein